METILSIIKMIMLKVLYLIGLPITPIGSVIIGFHLRRVHKKYNCGLIEKGSFSELIANWENAMHKHSLWQDIVCRLRMIFIVWNEEDFNHNIWYLAGVYEKMK